MRRVTRLLFAAAILVGCISAVLSGESALQDKYFDSNVYGE